MPTPIIRTLNDLDIEVLESLIRAERVRRRNQFTNPNPELVIDQAHQAPETYLAVAPSGGIPGATVAGGVLKPGMAICKIQYLSPTVSGDETTDMLVREVDQLVERVYNHSSAAVDAGRVVLIARDKYGNWIVANVGDLPVPGPGGTTHAPCTGLCAFGYSPTDHKWHITSQNCPAGCFCSAPQFCPPSSQTCGGITTPCNLPSSVPPCPDCVDYCHSPPGGGTPCQTATGCDGLPLVYYCTTSNGCDRVCYAYCYPPPGGVVGGGYDTCSGCLANCCTVATCSGVCVYDHAGTVVASNCCGCWECGCPPPPSTLPSLCNYVTLPCGEGNGTTTTNTSTTTTTPDPNAGWYCIGCFDPASGGLLGGCNFYPHYPTLPPLCQVFGGPYASSALCTASCTVVSTTTTSTTTDCPYGYYIYQWNSSTSHWDVVVMNCTSGGIPPAPPIGSGSFNGQQVKECCTAPI